MIRIRKVTALCLAVLLLAVSATGCSVKKDREGAREAAEGFMEALKNGSKDGINQYSSDEVAGGEFVGLYDAENIRETLAASLVDANANEEIQTRFDELCSEFETMLEEYQITDVTIGDDGTATAYITVRNSFPVDVIGRESTHEKVAKALEQYDTEHEEELQTLSDTQGEDAADEQAYNDKLTIILDIYQEEIALSEPVTYMLALTLLKNEETDSWYVSTVQSYDSSIAGTGAPAKETDTSATEISIDGASEAVSD